MYTKREFYVYMMASESKVLYIGYTNNLSQRVIQHKLHINQGFTHKYHVTKLVYYETYKDPLEAIAREKQLKGWRREKKIKLLEETNPKWKDLDYIEQLDFEYLKQTYGKFPPLAKPRDRDE